MTVYAKFLLVFVCTLMTSACTEAETNQEVSINTPTEYQGWKLLTGERYMECKKKFPFEGSNQNMKEFVNNCGTTRPPVTKTELSWLKKYTFKRIVKVKGGTFLMGDFGEVHTAKSIPPVKKIVGFTYNYLIIDIFDEPSLEATKKKIDLPYLKLGTAYWNGKNFTVHLDDYAMSSHMIEEQEYNVFAAAKAYPLAQSRTKKDFKYFEQTKEAPAMVTWNRAKEYCEWLGNEIGQPLGLPTEAQWEYAARNRGEFRLFATNNGLYEDGVNAITGRESMFSEYGTELTQRDQLYLKVFKQTPPNPLGFYNMQNMEEWVNDWYDADYFEQGKEYTNPQGPDKGTIPSYIQDDYETEAWRSVRGGGSVWSGVSKLTFFRDAAPLRAERSFRCVGKLK